jgi:hypothetical protein
LDEQLLPDLYSKQYVVMAKVTAVSDKKKDYTVRIKLFEQSITVTHWFMHVYFMSYNTNMCVLYNIPQEQLQRVLPKVLPKL